MKDHAWRMTDERGEDEPRGNCRELPPVVSDGLTGRCDDPRVLKGPAHEQDQVKSDEEADGDGAQRQSFLLPLHSSIDPSLPQNPRNEAKLESAQDGLEHGFEHSVIRKPNGERSQTARDETDSHADARGQSTEIHKQYPMVGASLVTAMDLLDSWPPSHAPGVSPPRQITACKDDTALLPCSEFEASAMIRSSHEGESDAAQEFRPGGATAVAGDVKGTG
jgi:hypothetical protein